MSDEQKVLICVMNCEIASYMSAYSLDKTVLSTKNIAELCHFTQYRARKAIKNLVSGGLLEKSSVGRPAICSYGEYAELICDAAPPINGYSLTKKAFDTEEWKREYSQWEQSLRELAEVDNERGIDAAVPASSNRGTLARR